jgi:acetyl-CoA carboxylase biotin carboxyl carrier protein
MATSKKAVGAAVPNNSKKPAGKPLAPKTKSVVKEPVSKTPNAIFNIDEINNLLMAVNHSNVNELKLEKGDFKITIRQGMPLVNPAPAPQVVHTAAPAAVSTPAPLAATPAPVPSSAPATSSSEAPAENLITVKSPMIGTFFRAAGPGKSNFVNVGDEVKVGQVICIVEAMKLFNEIESEFSGKIIKVLADDSSPVEYDQPLFLIEP